MNLEIIGTKSVPQIGDVFAYRVRGQPFLFGRVIKAGINIMGFDVALIYLYEQRATVPIAAPALLKENLLLPPILADTSLWKKGFLKTVDNRPILPSDTFAVHCFRDLAFNTYVDEERRLLPGISEPCGIYGVAPYTGFDNKVSRALGVAEAR